MPQPPGEGGGCLSGVLSEAGGVYWPLATDPCPFPGPFPSGGGGAPWPGLSLKGGGGRKDLRNANRNERSRGRSLFPVVMGPSLLQRAAVGGWWSLGAVLKGCP